MIKSTGIPQAASLWLRENNMEPELIQVGVESVTCMVENTIINLNLHDNKIRSIRYSPAPPMIARS